MAIAETVGVRIPKTYHSLDEAQVPFVIKPTNLSSAKGVQYILKDKGERLEVIGERDVIIQEFITGKGCGYEVYCRNGQILVEYGHIRLAEWPTSGGSSVLRAGYIHPDMRSMAEKILRQVPWTGFAMFEFKLTPSNELVLIEVNPRIWGSINQALQDHCPLFEPILGPFYSKSNPQLVPRVTNKSFINAQKEQAKSAIRTSLYPQVLFAMFGYAFKGKWSIVRDYLSHLSITRRDVNSWSDPLGLLSMVIRKIV